LFVSKFKTFEKLTIVLLNEKTFGIQLLKNNPANVGINKLFVFSCVFRLPVWSSIIQFEKFDECVRMFIYVMGKMWTFN